MTSQRFALVAPSLESAVMSRFQLLSEIHRRGHRIMCLAPQAADPKQATHLFGRLAAIEAEYRPISFKTQGFGLFNGARVHKALKTPLADWQPDCVLSYGHEALVHGVAAAKHARVARVVSLCSDLPDFLKPTVDASVWPSRLAVRLALALSDRVVFHNRDHLDVMRAERLVPAGTGCDVVAGGGVDVETQDALVLPDLSSGVVFLMAARLEAIRGVVDYIQAARRVSAHARAVKFVLLGLPARNENQSINVAMLGFKGQEYEVLDSGVDLRKALSDAHVFVYPSHSEGMPASILEALCAGRPVITTDTPGCRDTIDETVNGYLVPRGDVGALVEAMEAILKRPDLVPSMARAARLKAERRFDVRDVNQALITALAL